MKPEDVALAAFVVADAEHQAQLAGRCPEYDHEEVTGRVIALLGAERGIPALIVALRVRAAMQQEGAAALEAFVALRRMKGEAR